MAKIFNVNGACRPNRHYMVDIGRKLEEIKAMVDAGDYFAINRARQYGKTTTLRALSGYLKEDYEVVSLDFQRMSSLSFESEQAFVAAFSEELLDFGEGFPAEAEEKLREFVDKTARINSLQALFKVLRLWCKESQKPIVLMIDEVDTATNNQVFLDFLAQLRAAYLDSDVNPAFQSVILAGVYDIRNLKQKIRPDAEHKVNSPWNIAAEFRVDMGFSREEIAGMLKEYETDWNTGMNIEEMSGLIYDYTSGYPYLVSALCKNMDEKVIGTENYYERRAVWTKEGFMEAVKCILSEKSPLFESLINKLNDYPELKEVIYCLLFQGQSVAYNADNMATDMLLMFGFIKVEQGMIQIANRIFETRLYNYFLTLPKAQSGEIYKLALRNKEQFIVELKIWRGNAYRERGEEQLSGYLDYFHLNKGYMLSFNFNKKKEIGVKEIVLKDSKVLIEAVV